MKKYKIKITELGIEKHCARCKEWWPLDDEFWYKCGGGWHSYCKSCCTERRGELRKNAELKHRNLKRKNV